MTAAAASYTAAGSESATELNHAVFGERLNMYYQSLNQSLLAVILNSSILCWLLWNAQQATVLVSWYGLVLLVTAYRAIGALRYRRLREDDRMHGRWYRHAIIGAVLSGLTWGAAGYLLFSNDNIFNQSLLAFVIAGMCAGAVVSLATFLEACVPFLALSLLPFMVRLFSEGSVEALQLGGMAALYLVLMSIFASRVNRTIVHGFEMSHLRQRAEDVVQRQALFDDLTGLPNRRLLNDRLRQARARCERHGSHAALLFLDLDNFKRINDSLGHQAGDQLLIMIAERLQDQLRREDTAARLGGDEFVVLLTGLEGSIEGVIASVHVTAERIREAVAAPCQLGGAELQVSASIGVSMLPSNAVEEEDLLKHADTAMYGAKAAGRNSVRFFVREMQVALEARLRMEHRLRRALKANELKVFLQPQVDADGRLIGGEALIRWQSEGEWVPPSDFISVAEESGLIHRLGDFVIDDACRQLAALRADGASDNLVIALNVSPGQFGQPGFSDTVLSALSRHNVPGRNLELEVTESLLIDNMDITAARMQAMREHGVQFSIDDFGTGYSSLKYLKSLPVSSLKIDQSFVRDVLVDSNDAHIVRAIISMADALGLEVIAEGVETEDVRGFLLAAGCRRFQGYLFSPALPEAEFARRAVEWSAG